MTPHDFLSAIKASASESSVEDTIRLFKKPPGRSPSQHLLKLSKWYLSLEASDQQLLEEALRFATDTTIFGLLCILDGARAIVDPSKDAQFELYYVEGDKKVLINKPSDALHESYREFMDQP